MEAKYEVGTVNATGTKFQTVSGPSMMEEVCAIVRDNVANGKGSVLAKGCNILVRWQWNGFITK